jgi:hypothetical protein
MGASNPTTHVLDYRCNCRPREGWRGALSVICQPSSKCVGIPLSFGSKRSKKANSILCLNFDRRYSGTITLDVINLLLRLYLMLRLVS